MEALLAARKREDTEAFKQTYRHRAGIEGTHSQGTRTMGLRRSRYAWPAQNASGSCRSCYSHHCRATDQLAAGRSTSSNPHLSF
jgi:hypothetical protein